MAFVAVPQTAQFNVRYTVNGERCENTIYFRRTNGWGASDLSVGCVYLGGWFQNQVLPNLSTAVTLTEVYGVDLASVNGPTATWAALANTNGAKVGDPMPGSVAMCITFRTALRGRSYRGRNYVSGFVESQVTGNSFVAADVAAIVAAYDILLLSDMGIEADWVLVSRFSNNAARNPGVATPIIAALARDSYVDSQRRRLAQRGN